MSTMKRAACNSQRVIKMQFIDLMGLLNFLSLLVKKKQTQKRSTKLCKDH